MLFGVFKVRKEICLDRLDTCSTGLVELIRGRLCIEVVRGFMGGDEGLVRVLIKVKTIFRYCW